MLKLGLVSFSIRCEFMNLLRIKILILILFLVNSYLTSYSQDNQKHLQVKGQIFNSSGKVKNLMIRIIEMNKIVDTAIITNGKYNINLNLNAEYLLEFIAEDHHVKRIAFNTEIPSNKKKIPYFDLKINLLEKYIWQLSDEDKDLLDLPVGYIKYSETKELFYDYNKKYSKIINKEISKLNRK